MYRYALLIVDNFSNKWTEHRVRRGHNGNGESPGSNPNTPIDTTGGKASFIMLWRASCRVLPFADTLTPVRCERRNEARFMGSRAALFLSISSGWEFTLSVTKTNPEDKCGTTLSVGGWRLVQACASGTRAWAEVRSRIIVSGSIRNPKYA